MSKLTQQQKNDLVERVIHMGSRKMLLNVDEQDTLREIMNGQQTVTVNAKQAPTVNAKQAPTWLVVWLTLGAVALVACCVPNWLHMPEIFIPAGVFASSVIAALVFGVRSQK